MTTTFPLIFLPSPGSMPSYEEEARNINSQFIQHHLKDGENLIGAPIFSVSQTFKNLCQLIQPISASLFSL